MVPDKIRNMIASGDIEMVQLGASMLPSYIPESLWAKYMNLYIAREFGWYLAQTEEGTRVIKVYIPPKKGIYNQLGTRNVKVYTKSAISLDMISKAIESYFNKQKPPCV